MDDFIASAIAACEEVHQLILGASKELFVTYTQGFGGDFSSGIDLEAEAICFKYLSAFGSVFSEESGWMNERSSIQVILDPIDGSDNFASLFPYYGISISRETEGETREALVCNLANGDIFIRTSTQYHQTSLGTPNVQKSININPYAKIGLFEKAPEHPELSKKLILNGLKFRSPGALALSLAYAPYVKYVLFLGTMRPYDIQAGLFLSKHLHLFQDERYVLISADKELFERIRLMVEKEYF